MKLLVDTNIFIDFIEERNGFYEAAEKLITLEILNEVELWMSPTQLSDLFYQLTEGGKHRLAEAASTSINRIRGSIKVCSVGQSEFDTCIDSDWDDLEDAFIYEAARSIRADAIITRNQKDFALSKIPVFDCDEFFEWLKIEHGLDYSFIDMEFNSEYE